MLKAKCPFYFLTIAMWWKNTPRGCFSIISQDWTKAEAIQIMCWQCVHRLHVPQEILASYQVHFFAKDWLSAKFACSSDCYICLKVYRSGEQQEQEIKKALSHSDESEWGKPPNKMAGTGLTEDEREHQAHIRRYLHYYLHLLVQADDIEHLQAASQALSQPSIHTSHPGLKDLARYPLQDSSTSSPT